MHHPEPATPRGVLDEVLLAARADAEAWADTPPGVRAGLLGQCARGVRAVAARWVTASLQAKGFPRHGSAEAEEWLYMATVFRSIRLHQATCTALASGRAPDVLARRRPDGLVAVKVFPRRLRERLVYRGIRAEVQCDDLPCERVPLGGGLAVVLGAGNVSMIPVVDALDQLVACNRVVVLKLSPVNDYLAPLLAQAFAPLIRRGALRLVAGGASEGRLLTRHPGVDALHMTGSHATYRAILADLASARRSAVPFTSELGNVSPVIVVPGPWPVEDVRRQAQRIATWLVANAGFGCLTPRVIVQHRESPQRGRLLEELRHILHRVPRRVAYYPGAVERHAALLEEHPWAWRLGPAGEPGGLPWTVVPDLDPDATDDGCFRREAFCGLIAETALSAPTTEAFLDRAVDFANEVLWGSLCATVLVHPSASTDPAVPRAVDRAVERLRYGTVTVNVGTFAAYYLQVAPWGAYPLEAGQPIDSGVGRTANALLIRSVRKSVLWAPFAADPAPLLVTASRPDLAARGIARLEATR